MRFHITIILIIFVNVFSGAKEILDLRHDRVIVLDTAQMEIVYVHVATDPVLEERRVNYEMLTLGHEFRKYGGYDNYRIDSIYMADPDFNPHDKEYIKFNRQFDDFPEYMIIDEQSQEIMYFGYLLANYYRYSEGYAEIDWVPEDGVEEILGYECRKAKGRWRGRDWTAWYCDIPVDGGPWKFRGLPGLILKLEDASGAHYFEAMDFKRDVFPFGINERLYSNSTRDKFNASYKDYCENLGKFLIGSGMLQIDKDEEAEIANRRKFYSPIELE